MLTTAADKIEFDTFPLSGDTSRSFPGDPEYNWTEEQRRVGGFNSGNANKWFGQPLEHTEYGHRNPWTFEKMSDEDMRQALQMGAYGMPLHLVHYDYVILNPCHNEHFTTIVVCSPASIEKAVKTLSSPGEVPDCAPQLRSCKMGICILNGCLTC